MTLCAYSCRNHLSELSVRYTLWSRNRLLGETDLRFVEGEDQIRVGSLHPTPEGDRLMPVTTGVAAALRAASALGHDPTAEADVRSAIDRQDALDLQLRMPDGRVVQTEDIAIVDMEFFGSFSDSDRDDPLAKLTPEEEREIDEIVEERRANRVPDYLRQSRDKRETRSRYQILIRLAPGEWLP
jgi:hypothetical protein